MMKNTISALAFRTIQLVDLQGRWFRKPVRYLYCSREDNHDFGKLLKLTSLQIIGSNKDTLFRH